MRPLALKSKFMLQFEFVWNMFLECNWMSPTTFSIQIFLKQKKNQIITILFFNGRGLKLGHLEYLWHAFSISGVFYMQVVAHRFMRSSSHDHLAANNFTFEMTTNRRDSYPSSPLPLHVFGVRDKVCVLCCLSTVTLTGVCRRESHAQ